MKKAKLLFCAALLLLAGALVFGTGSRQPTTLESTRSNTLQLLWSPIDLLTFPWTGAHQVMVDMLYDTLLLLDPSGNPTVMRLAESYTVSPDGRTYTFTIRNNIKWHDGTPFTTEDIVWSAKTVLKIPRNLNGTIMAKFNNIRGMTDYVAGNASDVSGITSTARTVTFTLNDPDFTFLTGVALFAPLPKHLLGDIDPLNLATNRYWETNSVGTGMYRLESFVPGAYIRLRMNDDYYGEKPKIPFVQVTLASGEAGNAQTLGGGVDFMYSNTSDVAHIRTMEATGYYVYKPMEVNYVRFLMVNLTGQGRDNNSGNTKIMDTRVRQALVYALDLQRICDTLYLGGALPTYSNFNRSSQYYDSRYNQYSYDPDKARQLLRDAGWDFNDKIVLAAHQGGNYDVVLVIASYWEAIGLTVETNFMPGGTDATQWVYSEKPYDFNVMQIAMGVNMEGLTSLLSTNSYGNALRANYTNVEAWDRAYAAFIAAPDVNARKAAASEIQRLEEQYMPWIPLFLVPQWTGYNRRLNLNFPDFFYQESFPFYRGIEKWTLSN